MNQSSPCLLVFRRCPIARRPSRRSRLIGLPGLHIELRNGQGRRELLTGNNWRLNQKKFSFFPHQHAHVVRRRDWQRQNPLQNVWEVKNVGPFRRFLRFSAGFAAVHPRFSSRRTSLRFGPSFPFPVLSRKACFPVPSPRRSRRNRRRQLLPQHGDVHAQRHRMLITRHVQARR